MILPTINTRYVGQSFIYFPETDSTNDRAWAALPTSPANGTCFAADYQTKGKGQRNNTWYSDSGQNILLSVLLYPTFLPVGRIFQLTKVAALAVLQTVQQFVPNGISCIKWPNDILLNNKKIAGILIENQFSGNTILASVFGIGINVNQKKFEVTTSYSPTSLFLETNQEFDRSTILPVLFQNIEKWYDILQQNTSWLDREYLSYLLGFQEKRLFQNKSGIFEGFIIGVHSSGKLAIQIQNTVEYFDFKEVEFIL